MRDLATTMLELRRKDPRYQTTAYLFAHEALDHTLTKVLNLPKDQRRHVTASELLHGMRDFAVERFGYLARPVWEAWGIYSTSDWGNVIYNLITHNLMSANEDDRPEDFEGVFDFEAAFDRQWSFDRNVGKKDQGSK